MDMSDQKKTPLNNVVKGPWSGKKVREVKLPDTDVIELHENIQFAGELTQSLMVQMIHTMSENSISVGHKDFIRDMAMIIELVEGSIYRDMKMLHPTHKFVEQFVDIMKSGDTYDTEVDFGSIVELANLVEVYDEDEDEDEDDPKVP
eukprot:GHVR01024360.1.p2 GENE.GHVR01024360.1~~GHVR01024360.1.p2  ORF type:complete len:147 (+),score=29.98 GHVR01024360.1:195-635(+)